MSSEYCLLYNICLGKCKNILNIEAEKYESDWKRAKREEKAKEVRSKLQNLIPKTIIEDLFNTDSYIFWGNSGYEIKNFKFPNNMENLEDYYNEVEKLYKIYPRSIVNTSVLKAMRYMPRIIQISFKYEKSKCLVCQKEYTVRLYKECGHCCDLIKHPNQECPPYEGYSCVTDSEDLYIYRNKLLCKACRKSYDMTCSVIYMF